MLRCPITALFGYLTYRFNNLDVISLCFTKVLRSKLMFELQSNSG